LRARFFILHNPNAGRAARHLFSRDACADETRGQRFYVLRIVGSGPLNRIRQLSTLAVGLLRYDPGVRVKAINWSRIDADPAVPVQIDGEVLGALPLEINPHPKRLNLIFPLA
jgi:diacylglycerol kinase family enzyme